MSAAADTAGVQTVTVTINGKEVQAIPGQSILEVARGAGVDIPTLCHDPRLEPYGACRMCLVEVEGARGPMAACGTAVRDGMKIETHTEKVVKIRKFVLELLLTNHPLDCPVCEAAGDCRLQDYAYEYLVDMVPWGWRPPEVGEPGPHPNVAHFGSRCILCGRCVRICREVMGIGCWGYLNRGYESEVDTPYRLPLQEVECVSCGQCVSTCPVGAIVGQRSPQGARAWQTEKTTTTCSYCADGCSLVMHGYRDRVVKVTSDTDKGINLGNLCVKGRFGQGYVEAPDRITMPLVRNAKGELEEASWEDAIARVKDRLGKVLESKSGKAVAAICGTSVTNEAGYLVQKLMRGALGSANVDTIDRAGQAGSEEALEAAFGLAACTNSRKDLGDADVILVMGADLTASDPVFALTVVKALRSGKTVVVVDPRTTELAGKAAYHAAIETGTDVAFLRGVMKYVLDLGLADKGFIAERTEGIAALEESLKGVNVATEAATCGIDVDVIRQTALAFGQAGAAAIIYGTGVSEGPRARATVAALANLALLTGNVGRPGTGIYPLRSGANSQGLVDMGVHPKGLPGGVVFEAGLGADQIVAGIEKGEIVALYVVGADLALGLPDEERVRAALSKLEFLVVQESFPSDTAQYADVVLPAAVAPEDDGTFTNFERFVQRVAPATASRGEALPDWRIVQTLAKALGADWAYAQPSDVMNEIARVVPAYAGITYGKLRQEGVQWPCESGDAKGTPILFTTGFLRGKAAFAALPEAGPRIQGGGEFPYVLLTGSAREHHGTGVRSRRAPGITKLAPDVELQLNPADADALGVGKDGRVVVTSKNGGSVGTGVRITSRVPAGAVFLAGFSADAPAKRLLTAEDGTSVLVKVERAN